MPDVGAFGPNVLTDADRERVGGWLTEPAFVAVLGKVIRNVELVQNFERLSGCSFGLRRELPLRNWRATIIAWLKGEA